MVNQRIHGDYVTTGFCKSPDGGNILWQAMADITANGMELDRELVVRNRNAFADQIQELIEQLKQLPQAEGLFKQNRQKTLFIMNETSGKPSINQKRLREILQAIAEEKDLSPPSTGKTKELTTSVKWWGAYADEDPFLELWVQLEQTAKLSQFFGGLTEKRIHPKYSTLVRTRRTSCSSPNIQQLPREGGFREMVTAAPGAVLLTVDFSAIELRTLAVVCEKTFGFSRLAEVFRQRVEYLPTFVDRVWNCLQGLNRNPELRFAMEQRKAGEGLFRKLFWTSVETPTGRRRASVSFSQARNTPFQGLAADGAKLSLWRLYREGFRTVAFVHDEVVVELPEDSDHSAEAEKVVQLMVSSMSEVMDSDIPVEVEFSLSRRWWKNAEEVRSEDGQLLLWSPEVSVM